MAIIFNNPGDTPAVIVTEPKSDEDGTNMFSIVEHADGSYLAKIKGFEGAGYGATEYDALKDLNNQIRKRANALAEMGGHVRLAMQRAPEFKTLKAALAANYVIMTDPKHAKGNPQISIDDRGEFECAGHKWRVEREGAAMDWWTLQNLDVPGEVYTCRTWDQLEEMFVSSLVW